MPGRPAPGRGPRQASPQPRRLAPLRLGAAGDVWPGLRTRIAAISLLAETLRGERDRRVVERLATQLLAEAERAGRAIDDVVALAIPASAGAPHEDIVVGTVMADAVRCVESVAAHRAVTVVTHDRGRSVRIVGDRHQLVAAVAALLDNAVRHSAPGASVELSSESVGDEVRIAVRDHGCGMSADELDAIATDHSAHRDGGHGDGGHGDGGHGDGGHAGGLLVARHVATRHGGYVTAASAPGAGATFALHLPRVRRRVRSGAAPPP